MPTLKPTDELIEQVKNWIITTRQFLVTNNERFTETLALVQKLTEEILVTREVIELYQTAIRRHRDYRGDNRCWKDNEELYKILPEGYVTPKREVDIELKYCKMYIEASHNPNTTYISPQDEIDRLTKAIRDHKESRKTDRDETLHNALLE